MSKKKNRPKPVPSPAAQAGGERPVSAAAPPAAPAPFTGRQAVRLLLSGVLALLGICLTAPDTIKWVALLLTVATIALLLWRTPSLRGRLTWPAAALTLVVVMDGISSLYAVSGKFALSEFLKLLIALCVFLLILLFERGQGDALGRKTACVVEICTALIGLISIDLLSTRLLSSPFLGLMGLFGGNYSELTGLEEGIRMTSILGNPNVFAGCVGLGVLLSLALATTAEGRGERRLHLICLALNALSFVLAFSMGATATIAVAFLVYLVLERPQRRAFLLILMLETLLVTLAAAVPIYLTAFTAWDGIQPIPLLTAAAAAAVLCLLDELAGRRLAGRLTGHGRAVAALVVAVLAAVGVYAVLALQLTGGITLQPGESLRRADYPAPGSYTLTLQADGAVNVVIESQNRKDTMMHTSTELYRGPAQDAAFTVPEDSEVVYFNFSASDSVRLESASCSGDGGSFSLKLGYKLLPGFIANRLQGLLANQNAIQRVVFFEDGIKLFQRSPVFGLGIGAFENGIGGVQTFRYTTKYAHNHYIQAMVETGVIGLILFVGLLALSAAAILRARRQTQSHAMTAALGAALVFMAGHAAVEVVFSTSFYLPIAFAVFALISLCCGSTVALPDRPRLQSIAPRVLAVLMAAYAVLPGCNLYAKHLAATPTYQNLASAARLDKFEWSDYMLSYTYNAYLNSDTDPAVMEQAKAFAQRLEQVDSNIIPLYLSGSYFATGQPAKGFDMIRKYVSYVSADPETWQSAFQVIMAYTQDTPEYRAHVAEIYQMLQDWNADNMGSITLDETAAAYVEYMIQG